MLLVSLLSLLVAASAVAQTKAEGPAQVPAAEQETAELPEFQQLADEADFIALVQVEQTRYSYTREFPTAGYAVLRSILIYKADRHYERVEVDESGLQDDACYFPTTSPYADGRRYLVFLQRPDPDQAAPQPLSTADPLVRGGGELVLTPGDDTPFSDIDDPRDDSIRFVGHPHTCRIPALVTQSNRYALAWPIEGVALGEAGEAMVQPLTFSDPDARIDATELTGVTIERMLGEQRLAREGDQLVYTEGLYLSQVRQLMGPAALVLDRSLR